MIKFAVDENFNNDILRGLVRRLPEVDIARVQDVGLGGAEDARVLDWAVAEGRIVLTHDVSTLIGLAYERMKRGHGVPGVIAVPQTIAVGVAVDDLALIVQCTTTKDWQNQVGYLPLG
jgi:hypothetical protein